VHATLSSASLPPPTNDDAATITINIAQVMGGFSDTLSQYGLPHTRFGMLDLEKMQKFFDGGLVCNGGHEIVHTAHDFFFKKICTRKSFHFLKMEIQSSNPAHRMISRICHMIISV
jgi:hypothetical protein